MTKGHITSIQQQDSLLMDKLAIRNTMLMTAPRADRSKATDGARDFE